MTCLCWQRGGGGIAPTNSQPVTTRRCVISNTFRPLYPFLPVLQAVGWIPGQSERHEKSRSHRYSIPEPSSPQQVAIPTTLFRPPFRLPMDNNYHVSEDKHAKPGNFQARRNARSYDGKHWAEKCLSTVLLSEIVNTSFFDLFVQQPMPSDSPQGPNKINTTQSFPPLATALSTNVSSCNVPRCFVSCCYCK